MNESNICVPGMMDSLSAGHGPLYSRATADEGILPSVWNQTRIHSGRQGIVTAGKLHRRK
jgi:hypothetical protein